MQFGKAYWRTFEDGIRREWLLTNGIGGFACSTLIGANTRRYHGLLVASLTPPVRRHLVLSKIDECIIIGDKSYNLYSHKASGHTMNGFHHLQRVEFDPLPCFTYSVEDVILEKRVCMVYGENTTVIVYRIINGPRSLELRLAPLVNFRDYHHNSQRWHMVFDHCPCDGGVSVRPYNLDLKIRILCSDGRFVSQKDNWFLGMEYPVESERGLQPFEDHYIPGYFEIKAEPWADKYVTVIATVEDHIGCINPGSIKGTGSIRDTNGLLAIEREKERLMKLKETAGTDDEFASKLVLAADNFIVHRKSTGAKTIIAGYPWFTDWGRDAMIAFTGLTLCTRRFEEARQILSTFSEHVKYGLVPNVFPDEGQEPAYNTVDAALWFFEAVNKYIRYTGDLEFVKKHIFPVLKEIAGAYMKGTLFGIRMDQDGLITAGDEKTQLTWMDAKVGDYVVTPRHGKAVEINALWYNAMEIMSELCLKFGEDPSLYRETADKVKASFENAFWNDGEKCLYDVVNGDFRDSRIRPNQVLAVSLTHSVLTGEKAKSVVERVWRELYTAYGLRTLSPGSREYAGVYVGDQYKRDTAYHQGTAWAWLMGQFITAFFKVYGYSGQSRERAMKFIEPFKDHLKDACVGSISEIFDGDEPHTPRGCFAQAWSVGEVLRAYLEDILK